MHNIFTQIFSKYSQFMKNVQQLNNQQQFGNNMVDSTLSAPHTRPSPALWNMIVYKLSIINDVTIIQQVLHCSHMFCLLFRCLTTHGGTWERLDRLVPNLTDSRNKMTTGSLWQNFEGRVSTGMRDVITFGWNGLLYFTTLCSICTKSDRYMQCDGY